MTVWVLGKPTKEGIYYLWGRGWKHPLRPAVVFDFDGMLYISVADPEDDYADARYRAPPRMGLTTLKGFNSLAKREVWHVGLERPTGPPTRIKGEKRDPEEPPVV